MSVVTANKLGVLEEVSNDYQSLGNDAAHSKNLLLRSGTQSNHENGITDGLSSKYDLALLSLVNKV